ncbi:glycosyltransferase family 4 protein [Helicobacter sp. 23-1044]
MAKHCGENRGGYKQRHCVDSASKLKLLHLASDLHSGGAERVFANTIEMTFERNLYEIFVASCDEVPPPNIAESHFLRLDDWNSYPKIRGVFKYIFNLTNFTRLKKFLFEVRPNIIHTQNYLSRLSPSILFALRSYKRAFPQSKLIFTQHGYGVCANLCLYNYAKNHICEFCINRSKYHIAFQNCDRRGKIYSFLKALRVPFYQGIFLKEQNLFDKVIFVSEFQAKKHYLEGYKNSIVIPNPLELRFYNPSPHLAQKQNLIIYFGRIAKEKNIPLLIRAFARLHKDFSDYRLLIIGNGDEMQQCQTLADKILRNHSILFLPHLPPKKLKGILARAKISILPSLWFETFGLTIIESILAGVVPVASDIGALRETIDKTYGFTFEVNDEFALAKVMGEVLGDYKRYFDEMLTEREKILAQNENYIKNLIDLYAF